MATRKCFICRCVTTTALCDQCCGDIKFLGAPLPDPDATEEQLRQWAKDNKVQVFSCKMPG